MEKIKVNMTPCEEVKTIHASQNDNATRKWAFDLYDENGKIDSSDIKEQMIFDSRVGGTEQILPENTSNPTTSPIIADIQYPDSLRSEQTFLYRESPTTINGQAKITHIKGNTVVFNQLAQNGNFADTSVWSPVSITFSVSNNQANLTATGVWGRLKGNDFNTISGHKYLVMATVKGTTDIYVSVEISYQYLTTNNQWENIAFIAAETSSSARFISFGDRRGSGWTEFNVKNAMVFDLTAMGLDYITSADQFTSLYSLPYYAYTTGKLLPFKGEELKITGKNQLPITLDTLKTINTSPTWNDNVATYNGVTFIVNTDESGYLTSITLSGVASASSNLLILNRNVSQDFNDKMLEKSLTLNGCPSGGSASGYSIYGYRVSTGSVQNIREVGNGVDFVFKPSSNGWNIAISVSSGANVNGKVFYPMIRLADVTDDAFEPYTSSTINLPTLNYFPTGMKSVPNGLATQIVRDELLENKAIPRVGVVDMGELNWQRNANYNVMYAYVTDKAIGRLNIVTDTGYEVVNKGYTTMSSGEIAGTTLDNGINCKDDNYTSASAFKTAMSGKYLYYELATPTEESITTASLVTEKGESPLYYDDELIADCNETISSESGIFDAKIKLMTDETIYSQKIQLHVERKP